MATQEDRSLSAGMAFPKWMKNKINDKYDFDQSTFSPTELDDSFIFRYRQPAAKNNNEAMKITSNLTDSKIVTASQINSGKADFSNIKSQSQKYLQNSGDPTIKNKPKGTDDGFKGETAKVGSSVVRVAQQMVSGKIVQGTTKPEEECEQLLAKFDPYRRRGSKSLPASPLSSPGSSPKVNRRVNKYFTGPFMDTEKPKGWILSNLLTKREMSQSMSYIGEESKKDVERASSTMSVDEMADKRPKTQVIRAKPSQLREMNFWSPTSM